MQRARDCINEVVQLGLAPMFKANGFKKSGFNFWRRIGTVTNYFNLQVSQWNQGAEGQFYLNAGVIFDELFSLRGEAVPNAPKYDLCQFMVRLENLNKELPQSYAVNADTKPDQLARELTSIVERTYVRPLDTVHNAKDFEATGWVSAIPWGFPAEFAYVLGNVEEARRLIQAQANRFADRGCTFESVAASLRLTF
jgi:hypothetical protein